MKISRACKLLQISRSVFYPKIKQIKNGNVPKGKVGRPIPGFSYGISNCKVDDSIIETLLHEACERTPFYGYKKITKILRKNHGVNVNAKKVYRLAKKLGLLLPYIKHTKQGHLAIAREVSTINQLWQIDIKYVRALNGQFIMLTDIIDVYSRELVGREITKTATTNDALKAIEGALIENNISSNLV